MAQEKTETIITRVGKELKEQLLKLAEEDHRNLSDYIRLQLIRIVENQNQAK